MSTTFQFGNKKIKTPGSYSKVESGVQNPPAGLDFGSLLVIDTGSGNGWGGGSGVNGENGKGKDSIFEFDNIQDFRSFVKGGLWFDLSVPLFRPSQLGIPGISKVTYIKAATTASGSLDLTWTGGAGNGGTLTFETKSEGTHVNGVLNSDSDNLLRGFAVKMRAGTEDANKFALDFYEGTYKGLDSAGEPISLSEAKSKEIKFSSSVEFDNIQQVYDWVVKEPSIVEIFNVTVSVQGTGVVDSDDLTATSGYQLISGATESYNPADLDLAIESVKDIVFDFILADRWGDDALDTENLEILAMASEMPVKPDVYFGGGVDALKFTQTDGSIPLTQTLNSESATVVHSGIKVGRKDGTGFKTLPSIYTAAFVLGREAGLQPENSLTFKGVGISGMAHSLNQKEVEKCLDSGVIAIRKENNQFSIVKGVNSLQDNDDIINEDGTTHSKQLRRIVRQLNKEISINSKLDLLISEEGVNRLNLSEGDVKNWLETYLLSVTGTLIVRHQSVTVKRIGDSYHINYAIEPNTEINFLFFTGLVINV